MLAFRIFPIFFDSLCGVICYRFRNRGFTISCRLLAGVLASPKQITVKIFKLLWTLVLSIHRRLFTYFGVTKLARTNFYELRHVHPELPPELCRVGRVEFFQKWRFLVRKPYPGEGLKIPPKNRNPMWCSPVVRMDQTYSTSSVYRGKKILAYTWARSIQALKAQILEKNFMTR